MHAFRNRLLVISTALLLTVTGCASEPENTTTENQVVDTGNIENSTPDQATASKSEGTSEISIPSGAYAASAEFPFPVPEGWSILDPFVEGKLGKDISMDGSIEYPGDAKDAAATYLDLLKAAGFDAYTYGPGELTNQASLAAEGMISGTSYTAILNFDTHADGLQRVSITAVEDD